MAGNTRQRRALAGGEEIALVHELQVHQVELEAQNEELRHAHDALHAQQQRYREVFDQCPFGYLFLSDQGLILEANGAGSTLLGVAQGALVNQPFIRFILPEDQDAYKLLHQRLAATGTAQEMELRMARSGGPSVWVRLHVNITVNNDNDGHQLVRVVMSDISEQKQVEETLLFLAHHHSSIPGEDFFTALARYLAQGLGMDFVCIDSLEDDGFNARTVAVYHDGCFLDNVTYALKDTPCGEVVGKVVCCFPSGVCRLFPRDAVLKDLRAESYVGVTLWGNAGHPIGLIAVIGRQPLRNPSLAEAVLKVVAVRAADELERLAMVNARMACEKRYRTLLQTAMEGFCLTDMLGHLVEVNEAFCRMSGYSTQELLTMRISDLEAIDTAADIAARIHKVRQQGNDRFESRIRGKDGSLVDIEVSVQCLPIEGGRLVIFVHNITEAKRSAAALLQERNVLAGVMLATDAMLVYLDTAFNFVAVNPAYAEACGMRQEAMIGRNHFELYPHAENEAIFRRVRDTGQPVFYKDKPFVFPDQPERGTTYWDWSLSPLSDPGGQVTGLVFSLRETTQVKLAELRLATQARLADLFMTSSNGELFDKVMAVIQEVMHSPLGFFGYLDEAGDLVAPATSRPVWSAYQSPNQAATLPMAMWGNCNWGRAVMERKTTFSNMKSCATPPGHPIIWRYITVPILYQGTVGGVLQVANKETDYTATEIATMEAIAHYIAPILSARLQRDQSLAALRRSEESYRLQFAQNSSMMMLLDPEDGAIVDANAAAIGFYGYSRDQLLAMRITAINDLANAEVQADMAFITDAHGRHFERQHRLADGTVREVEVSTSLIKLGGRPLLHAIIHDITQRKRAERELQQRNETYRDILATTLDGFWLMDFHNHILDVNDSYLRQSGYSRRELLDMGPHDLDIHETAADTAEHTRRTLASGYAMFETIHRRKDGSTWHVEVSVGVSNRAGGQLVVFLRDITERKQAEEIIARSLREKEVLLKEIHHRVKNNMQVVASLLNIQAQRNSAGPIRAMFEESRNRVVSMALIHEKLYQTRDLAHVNFKEYLQCVAKGLSGTYNHPGAVIVLAMENITLDVNQGIPCGLIVNELVSNALKYAFPEGRKGIIRLDITKKQDGDNVLTVEDNGIGFPDDIDFRNTSSLGLQLVNGLTAQLQGRIELVKGDGTTFTITFPATS